jgi:hypothetical protein
VSTKGKYSCIKKHASAKRRVQEARFHPSQNGQLVYKASSSSAQDIAGLDDLRDQDCERGKVTQQPLIAYAQFKYKPWVTKPNSIKIKLHGGDQFICDLISDTGNVDTYLKWIQVFMCVLDEKKLHGKLNTTSESLKKVLEELKKFLKVPKRETLEQKVTRELEAIPAKVKAMEANAVQPIAIGACYDLFCELLADDPHIQWDSIVREVHNNNPWTALDGSKHMELWMKTSELLEDCITFHKLTVFSCGAVEQQKSYMMESLKKPHGMSIKKHGVLGGRHGKKKVE